MWGWRTRRGAVGLTLVVAVAWLAGGPGATGGVAAGAGAGGSTASLLAQVAPLSPPVALKAGLVPVASAAGFYVAMDRGYFRDEGLDVSVETFDTGAQMVPAIGTGQVDVGAGGAVSAGLFNAIARGIPLRIVGAQSLVTPGHGILALMIRQDLLDSGAIRDFPDLRGRRMAIAARASTSEILLDAALARGGLTLRDVDVTEISLPDMTAALANRSIDGAAQTEPTSTISVERGFAARWRSSEELTPGLLLAAWIYSPQLVEQRPEAGRRFMVGLLRGVRDYVQAFDRGGDREPIVQSLIRWTPLKDRALYDRIISPGVAPDGYIDLDNLQNDLAWYARNGYIPDGMSARTIVDHQFADYAVGRLGRFQ